MGQVLYYVLAGSPNVVHCSWGGPTDLIGGNAPADGEWAPAIKEMLSDAGQRKQTLVALCAARAVEDLTVAARWGDSACSFVVDLQGLGAHYALPADIAFGEGKEKSTRQLLLQNTDHVLAAGSEPGTQLCPLQLVGGGGELVWRVRPLLRARSFWLVSFLTISDGAGPAGGHQAAATMRIGMIEWAEVPVVVRPCASLRAFEQALAIAGWL